jgi:hypothetical protein
MKVVRSSFDSLATRPFYSTAEIEHTCSDALAAAGLMPAKPEQIRIERFIERRLGVWPIYEDLPAGVLGYTEFGAKGVVAIHVARSLSENGDRAERVLSSTMAHEAGHGLFQAHLFAVEDSLPLFESDPDVSTTRILCRGPRRGGGYDGRWWEFQANLAIGALLIPRTLIDEAIEPFLEPSGSLGIPALPESRRVDAAILLAETFHVTENVARIRLEGRHPPSGGQLTL